MGKQNTHCLLFFFIKFKKPVNQNNESHQISSDLPRPEIEDVISSDLTLKQPLQTRLDRRWLHWVLDLLCLFLSSLSLSLTSHSIRGVFKESGKDIASVKKKSIEVGPWGGNGGTSWDDGTYKGVREITLVYDRCIDSICVVYDKNGKPIAAGKHGGVGGNQTAQIKLQYPEEFLTSVSGHYCPVVYGGSPVIRSLTFKSNKRTFGPFGVEEGTPFTFPMDGGLIVGFKGRSGWYLDAIGFRLSRAQTTKLIQRVQNKFKKLASMSSASKSSAA